MMKRNQKVAIYVGLAAFVMFVLVLAIGIGAGGVKRNRGGVNAPGVTPPVLATPEIQGPLNPAQRAAFERLTNESTTAPTVLTDQGVIRFLTADVAIPDSQAVGARGKADYFISRYADLLQIRDLPNQLAFKADAMDIANVSFIRYAQHINGVPVFGSDLIVSVTEQGHVDSINAGYIPGLSIDTNPSVPSNDAANTVLADLGITGGKVDITTTLMIFDQKVFSRPSPDGAHLAWQVVIQAEQVQASWIYLIDAKTGGILEKIPVIQTARNREVWDAHEKSLQEALPPYTTTTQIMNESGALPGQSADADATAVWTHSGQVYDYYWLTFRRDSYDNKGSTLVNYTHIMTYCPNNAFWHPKYQIMFYCTKTTGLDVIAHELTHAVTSSTANLVYKNEQGALNESYSDVFAAMIDTVEPWLIALDDANQQVIRNMGDPAKDYPRKYQDLVKPGEGLCKGKDEKENGCVHINSSIPNLAAYYLSEGSTDNNVRGIGKLKIQQIYYETLAFRLNANSDFAQARKATIEACKALVGYHGIVEADCDQVKNAFAAVGIGSSSSVVPPPVITSASSTMLVFDTSGSMQGQTPDGVGKLTAAQNAGTSILDIIAAENQTTSATGSQVGIVDFNRTTRLDSPLSSDVNQARTALNSLNATGGTGMPLGLQLALDQYPTGSSTADKKIIILLSDGQPNVGLNGETNNVSLVQQQVLDLATQASNRGICIHTVGFGDPNATDENSRLDEEFLKQVANTSGCGSYNNAQSANQLANTYIQLRHATTGNVLLQQDGQISQGQTVDIGKVKVENNQSLLLYTLSSPGNNLDAVLKDPAGSRVDQTYPNASLSSSNTLTTIIVSNPRSGQWNLSAYGVNVPSGVTSYNAILSTRGGAVVRSKPSGGIAIVLIILVMAGGGVAFYVMNTKRRKPAGPQPTVGAISARLVGVNGPVAGRAIPIGDGFLIGRSPGCQLRLVDPSVSRQHARIRLANGQWFIQDLGSAKGTLVNGQPVQAVRLNPGDRITIGGTTFLFQV